MGREDLRRYTVATSPMDEWCEVLHGRLIITPDGNAKEEDA